MDIEDECCKTHSSTAPCNKLKLNCNLNIFIDLLFQMQHGLTEKGKPYLEATTQEIAEVVVNNFIDKDNHSISLSTVRTILTPTKSSKRPNTDKRINLKPPASN